MLQEKYCCDLMKNALDDPRVYLYYDQIKREYRLPLKFLDAADILYYCPWCGKKLPSSLRDTYYDILEKEYTLDNYDINDNPEKIPQEFKSDEWWKKRGL